MCVLYTREEEEMCHVCVSRCRSREIFGVTMFYGDSVLCSSLPITIFNF
jgi:hypothetical protein